MLRIAFDLDGVLADFSSAHEATAESLLARTDRTNAAGLTRVTEPVTTGEASVPSAPTEGDVRQDDQAVARAGSPSGLSPRLQARVWRTIRAVPDFWTTLQPIEPGVIHRIQELAVRHRWETFFVTQRPATAGETVQRQSQHWLVEQGFPLPSVIVHSGGRGKLAAALQLDFLVDDTVEHCVNAIDESNARPILIRREQDAAVEANADGLGITVCRTVAEALDLLEQVTIEKNQPPFLHRMAKKIGL